MPPIDPFAAADEAGLVYVNDAMPGITREREGNAWTYRDADGAMVDDPAERRRIDAMRIPPAWLHVWISPIPDGHILATGRDAKARKTAAQPVQEEPATGEAVATGAEGEEVAVE